VGVVGKLEKDTESALAGRPTVGVTRDLKPKKVTIIERETLAAPAGH